MGVLCHLGKRRRKTQCRRAWKTTRWEHPQRKERRLRGYVTGQACFAPAPSLSRTQPKAYNPGHNYDVAQLQCHCHPGLGVRLFLKLPRGPRLSPWTPHEWLRSRGDDLRGVPASVGLLSGPRLQSQSREAGPHSSLS